MAEGQTKKLAGKYGTPEELEAAYAALEAKLGEQGQQLGTLQQQLQQAAQALTEFGEWTKAAKPIVDWYSTNANDVKTWWEGRGQQGQGAQPGVRQQAQQLAQQQPGYEWLTPQEREGLIQESAKYLQANMLQPWTQQFGQQIDVWLEYHDDNRDGIVDESEGTGNPVREEDLIIAYFDQADSTWKSIASSWVDAANNLVRGRADRTATFALVSRYTAPLARHSTRTVYGCRAIPNPVVA